MKIINKNTYNIMYGLEFINAGEVKDIEDEKVIKMLLSQPNVEEYVDIAFFVRIHNDVWF